MGGQAFEMRRREVETTDGLATICYLVCQPLEQAGFANAFSTRLGGVSALPENSLSLTYFKGDDNTKVDENRRRFLKAIGCDGARIVTSRQTHSIDITSIDSALQDAAQPVCDAMTSKLTGILLGIQTADCLPVLIADTK